MFSFFGLGKARGSFGRWLDNNGISQQDVADWSGVSKSTISNLSKGDAFTPSIKSAVKIIKALRKEGYNVDIQDFWGDM